VNRRSALAKSFIEESDGLIDIEQINNEAYPNSNYFISGPPAMIKAFKNNLIPKGVSATNILTDRE
jgi:NAD(P)H-flavin reductase